MANDQRVKILRLEAERNEARTALAASQAEVERLRGELAWMTGQRDRFRAEIEEAALPNVTVKQALDAERAEVRSLRERVGAAEGLLREETDACVCETIDPRDVGRTVTSPNQVACGECWWCRVRAHLAGAPQSSGGPKLVTCDYAESLESGRCGAPVTTPGSGWCEEHQRRHGLSAPSGGPTGEAARRQGCLNACTNVLSPSMGTGPCADCIDCGGSGFERRYGDTFRGTGGLCRPCNGTGRTGGQAPGEPKP